jgi:predicted nucleotidyltransferase
MKPRTCKKRLPAKARSLLAECKRIIEGFLPDATVLLYGSQARGTATPESDYDLLVLTAMPLTSEEEDRIGDAVYDLEREQGAVISLLFFAREQWDAPLYRLMPLHREVEREGIVL